MSVFSKDGVAVFLTRLLWMICISNFNIVALAQSAPIKLSDFKS